ncbi:MAG TPA: TIGR00374 family protein [Myxococcales bacterium]|nr:TIGR00374 family protein [Myxococcales bacterium]
MEGREGSIRSATEMRRHSRWTWLSWMFGAALLATVATVATRFSEERDFARLLRSAQPGWLLMAAVLQLATYVAEAGAWRVLLRAQDWHVPLRSLTGLSVAKLFLDQAIPSAGISGALLVVRGLERREVPRETSLSAVLLDLRGYFAAYGAALGAALVVLWGLEDLTAWVLVPAAILFLIAAAAFGLLEAWSRGHGLRWITHLPLRSLREQLAIAPSATARDWRLLAAAFGFELAVFLLDALTLWMMLLAVGTYAPLHRVFASFMLATVARTLGVVPGGLGTFEAVSVATLHLVGVPVAAGLAATLLFRGYSFWLPMLPGFVLARRESRGESAREG